MDEDDPTKSENLVRCQHANANSFSRRFPSRTFVTSSLFQDLKQVRTLPIEQIANSLHPKYGFPARMKDFRTL